jgi:uncharacterized protein (TIGR03000 family)
MRSTRWAVVGLVCVVAAVLASVGAGQEGKGKAATIIVHLPKVNAKLTLDGAATTGKGKKRTLTTKALAPGKMHTFTLVATWRDPRTYSQVVRTKDVVAAAGQTVEADMRKEDPKRRDQLIVEFEPTGRHIVEAMCKLGEVGKDDVVYDLGCGDGRIIIAAVKKYGAKKGVGVEIDRDLVRKAKAAVKKAGLADKIEIRRGDVLKITDLSEATVVMLYLSKDLNLRLRPVLQKTLKPGSRIVSHYHSMGDWEPEKEIKLQAGPKDKEVHSVFLWRIGKAKK